MGLDEHRVSFERLCVVDAVRVTTRDDDDESVRLRKDEMKRR